MKKLLRIIKRLNILGREAVAKALFPGLKNYIAVTQNDGDTVIFDFIKKMKRF